MGLLLTFFGNFFNNSLFSFTGKFAHLDAVTCYRRITYWRYPTTSIIYGTTDGVTTARCKIASERWLYKKYRWCDQDRIESKDIQLFQPLLTQYFCKAHLNRVQVKLLTLREWSMCQSCLPHQQRHLRLQRRPYRVRRLLLRKLSPCFKSVELQHLWLPRSAPLWRRNRQAPHERSPAGDSNISSVECDPAFVSFCYRWSKLPTKESLTFRFRLCDITTGFSFF